MKKIISILLITVMSVSLLTGCKKENNVKIIAEEESTSQAVETQPESEAEKPDYEAMDAEIISGLTHQLPDMLGDVSLTDYKGIKPDDDDTSAIIEEFINQQTRNVLRQNTVSADVFDKDCTATVRITTTVDGKPTSLNYDNLQIDGSDHAIFESFAEHLFGKGIGPFTFDTDVPDNCTFDEIAGKHVSVTGDILDIRKIPELTDENIGLMGEEFKTVEEYRNYIAEQLGPDFYETKVRENGEKVLGEICDNSTFIYTPGTIDAITDMLILESYIPELYADETTISEYLDQTGMTYEEYRKRIEPYAMNVANRLIALDAIAKENGIQASEDAIKEFNTGGSLTAVIASQIKEDEKSYYAALDETLKFLGEGIPEIEYAEPSAPESVTVAGEE